MLTTPLPDGAVLSRRAEIVACLRGILPGEGVIAGELERRAHESDGLAACRMLPMVVLPEAMAEVVAILRYCGTSTVACPA